MLRRLDALGRFLLEGMKHPDVIANPDSVNQAERAAPVSERDFEDAGAQALHRLCDISLASLGRDRQRRETGDPGALRNVSNSCSAAFSHDTGRVLRGSTMGYWAPSIEIMLSYLTTSCNYHSLKNFPLRKFAV